MDSQRLEGGRSTLARRAWLVLAALALASATARAGDSPRSTQISVSTGFDYSRGDYGESADTEIWYVPFGLKVEHDPWILRVTVPYLRIRAPAASWAEVTAPSSWATGAAAAR